MNLYEINQGLLECIDTETGEVLDVEKLRDLMLAKEDKLEGIACWIKNLTAEAAALKAEKQAFAERQAKTERLIESLKRTLANELQGEKFSTTRVAVSFRRSEQVSVDDVEMLPLELVTFAEPTPNKAEIKRILKSGGEVAGCSLIECLNVQIK